MQKSRVTIQIFARVLKSFLSFSDIFGTANIKEELKNEFITLAKIWIVTPDFCST